MILTHITWNVKLQHHIASMKPHTTSSNELERAQAINCVADKRGELVQGAVERIGLRHKK